MRWIFIVLLGFSFLQAQTIKLEHHSELINIQKDGSFDRLEYRGKVNLSALNPELGVPDLPFYIYRVVLEPGVKIKSFRITNTDYQDLAGKFNIIPRQKPWTQFSNDVFIEPDPEIYQSSQPYPRQSVQFLGIQFFNGKPIAHFAISPFQYIPAEQKIRFIKSLEFLIQTENATEMGVQPLLREDSKIVDALLNPTNEIKPSGKFKLPASTDEIDPELLASGLIDRYVIITAESLKPALQPLAEWKTRRGVPTVIRTLSWIRQNFPNGVDDAERMRNFIRWSYSKRGTRYVLLAGDTELIPTRIIHTGDFTFAADYYFADLDGTWNADQDDTFGEAPDKVQGYPEVYVARIPAMTPEDADRFVTKLFQYEKLDSVRSSDYPANVLYIAANLQKENDSRDQLILKHIDPQINPVFKRTLITQSENIGSDPQVTLDELNKGYGLIFTETHGLYYTIRPGARGSDLYNYNMEQLTTPDPPIWYMASCYTNDILKRCFGEEYILSKTGGGVAYIGNSSWEYPFSGIYLEKEFFNLAFNKGYYHLSEAHYLSRLPYLGYLNFEGPSRIIVYSTLVLGDPEMPIWTNRVQNFKIEDQIVTKNGKRWLNVTVLNDSTDSPIPQTTVVLYKKDQLYRIQRTSETGVSSFDLTNVNTDSVFLTISTRNYRPFEKILNLTASDDFAGKLLSTRFKEINGNQNNQCEPNEEFALYLKWKNTGVKTWQPGTQIALRQFSSLFYLKDSLVVLSQSVLPDDSVTFGPFNLSIAGGIDVDTTLVLRAELASPSGQQLAVNTSFNIYVPRLTVFSQTHRTILADTTLGKLYYTTVRLNIRNTGRGKASDIKARLISTDPLAQVVQDQLSMAQLSPRTTAEFEQEFIIEHREELSDIHLKLILNDYSGNHWEYPVDFTAPSPPPSFSFRPDRAEGILLTWKPSADNDVYGYHIYRSENPETEFYRITQNPLKNAGYFIDNQVDSNLPYFYSIRTVDSSGNFSATADTIRAWSALPRQYGFPVRPNVKAIGSEVSGVTSFDLNGDGKKELIASGGNGQLHVYDSNGTLLFKLNDLEGDLTFPAVGNVNGLSEHEIVVSSFREGQPLNNIYVINGENGQLLSQLDLQYNAPSPVVLSDLDHDGFDEIIVLTHAGNSPQPPKNSRLFILTDSSGFLKSFKDWPSEGFMFDDRTSLGNVAVADLDNSGELSVIVPTQGGKLFCFKPDSSPNPVWIKSFSGYLESPLSLADLNNDGFLEIVLPIVKTDRLYVLDYKGDFFPGWEGGKECRLTDPYGHSSPAIIGNVDQDTDLEIIYVGRDKVYIFKNNGQLMEGWPKPINNGDGFFAGNWEILSPYNSPVLADINQDGIQEIIYLDTFGYIHALSSLDGNEVAGFPLYTKNDMVKAHSPVVDDIDSDGDLEVLTVNHEGVLLIWDAPQKYSSSTVLYWNQPLGNAKHTGEMDTLHLEIVSAITSKPNQIPEKFYLKPNYPNPFNPTTKIEFGLKEPAWVELTIFNILGQKITTLVDNQLLGSGVHRKIWSGNNNNNLGQASGIYFYRLVVRDKSTRQVQFSKVRKMIKIK
ncbi:MAG: T9SS type A sorting domain-containing protein [Calditrichaeota bacterium]|nr:T9SS type A sorting domain-containing protein [Calditrichota bacterium]